jgi:hypothetical protein
VSTADSILAALGAYDLKQESPTEYRCNSPLRPGSNSHSFKLTIHGPEHGAYRDHVSGDSGSLYDLADKLGIPRPAQARPALRQLVQTYDYVDEQGQLLYQTCRYEPGKNGKPKDFMQRRPDGQGGYVWSMQGFTQYVLYRLPEVLAAIKAGEIVYLVEGEKDAETLRSLGLVATCNVAGSGAKWHQAYTSALTGAQVVIIPDNDPPGHKHAHRVVTELLGTAQSMKRVDLPGLLVHGDVTDWLGIGHTLAELRALVDAAPLITAPQQPSGPSGAAAATVAGRLGPVAAFADALEAAGYVFRLETESNCYFLNGRRLDEHQEKLVKAAVIDQNLGKPGYYDNAVAVLADKHKYARIRDRLRGLTWDEQAHIARLADHLLTRPGDVIIYADGTQRRAAEAFLRRWLIGAVGQILDQQQNLVLVLAGPQDAGKSAFARWLGSILPEAYYEGRFEPEAKDTALRMLESLVWEIGELDGVTSKHAAAILKLMLTQEEVIARRAYGRYDIRGPVRASFIGTVNDDNEGFLVDPTGNRRYMVISLTGIDWAYTQLDATQVWAEAVAAYQAGERGRPSDEERAWRDRVNAERHEVKGPLFDHLAEYFAVTGNADHVISNADIHGILAAHQLVNRPDRKTQMDIAAPFKRLGAKKFYGRLDGRIVRGWSGIQETLTSFNRRGAEGPTWGNRYATIEPDDCNNLGPQEVVTGVVTEVVTAQQEATNTTSVTTVTTFLEKHSENESGQSEADTLHADSQKFSEFGGEVVAEGDLPHSDELYNLSSEVVTGDEVLPPSPLKLDHVNQKLALEAATNGTDDPTRFLERIRDAAIYDATQAEVDRILAAAQRAQAAD